MSVAIVKNPITCYFDPEAEIWGDLGGPVGAQNGQNFFLRFFLFFNGTVKLMSRNRKKSFLRL